MSLPKTWTECHEGVTRKGEFQPCDNTPVVALRSDITTGRDPDDPRSWYPVCKRHVREPMVDLWDAFQWAAAVEPAPSNTRQENDRG